MDDLFDAIDNQTPPLMTQEEQSSLVESESPVVNEVETQSDATGGAPNIETPGLFDDDDGVPFKLGPQFVGLVYPKDAIIDDAFKWFRDAGFPYRKLPVFVMKQQINALANAPQASLRQTSEAYSVADSFHPHRFHATVGGKVSPLECFNHDVKFRHALELRMERAGGIPPGFFGELTLSRGTQQCSNFRPGFACWMYRRFCAQGATVLDTSTGYGGRLVGWIASRIGGRYIGIDPNTLTHEGNLALAAALGVRDQVTLYNLPAEDVDPALLVAPCDFAFTSPPYFSKEHYSDEETQSWRRYGHSFAAWVDGFLKPMLALTFAALKPGAYAAINIEDVTIKTTRHGLVQATIDAAVGCGFLHIGNELFEMQPRLGANQDVEVATERVLVFRRPEHS